VVSGTPPAALPSGESLGSYCMGPMAALEGCGKYRPPLGFDPQANRSIIIIVCDEYFSQAQILSTRYEVGSLGIESRWDEIFGTLPDLS